MLSQQKKQAQSLKKLNFFYTLFFSSLLFPVTASSKPLLVFVNKDESIVTFQLKSNPTTGYRWKLVQFDKSKLKLSKTRFIANQPQLMGSGGQEEFVFKRLDSGSLNTKISLRYQRSWEPNKGPEQIVKISTDQK